MTARCFKPLYGFCTHLDIKLDKDDFVINLPEREHAKLCKELGKDNYTYLVVSDGLCHEILQVWLCEGYMTIDRGVDGTDRGYWPCGASVKFDMVTSAIQDLMDQTIDLPDAECEPQLFTGTICNGNCTVHFEDGLAIKETPNKRQIADGCYDHPVPTYKDGKLVALAEGSPTFVDNGCCG